MYDQGYRHTWGSALPLDCLGVRRAPVGSGAHRGACTGKGASRASSGRLHDSLARAVGRRYGECLKVERSRCGYHVYGWRFGQTLMSRPAGTWPTDPPPIIYYDAKAGERSLDVMRWGLSIGPRTSRSAFSTFTPEPRGSTTRRPSARRFSGADAWCRCERRSSREKRQLLRAVFDSAYISKNHVAHLLLPCHISIWQ